MDFEIENRQAAMIAKPRVPFRWEWLLSRFFTLVLCAAMIVAAVPQAPRAAGMKYFGPYLVYNYKTKQVYEQHKAFDLWHPASLTKMMTAYTVFREIKAGRISQLSPIKVSQNALNQPPSKMGFPVGTVLNVDAALKIIMVKSANDIALAIAESVGGSEEAFVGKMNAYAREIGMKRSHFVNPHGLHDPNQYVTAYDMAVLADRLYTEFPKYAGYFAIPAIKVGKRTLSNHNPLLQRFPGTMGMKTGFVCASGLNIVASAKTRGKTLIAVVLGGRTGRERNVEAAKLLYDASHKGFAFALPKLKTLKPNGPVNSQPTDIRAQVCGKQKPNFDAVGEDEADNLFAVKQPSLSELEKRYLLEKGTNTRVVPVVLGNATGPDPFGLVAPEPPPMIAQGDGGPDEASAYATGVDASAAATAAANAAGVPTQDVFQLNGKAIAVPTPRPMMQ